MSTRKFAETHEWILPGDEGIATVGISNFAQDALGDIVFVELPAVGRKVAAKEQVAVVESVKSVSDIFSPASGEIVAINDTLGNAPEGLNSSDEHDAWLFRIKLQDPSELDALLDEETYASRH